MKKLKEIINQYKVSLLILGSFLAVVIIGIAVYSMQVKSRDSISPKEEMNRIQTLQNLEASSNPVTKTDEEQISDLRKLESSSKNNVTSPEARVNILLELERQSQK